MSTACDFKTARNILQTIADRKPYNGFDKEYSLLYQSGCIERTFYSDPAMSRQLTEKGHQLLMLLDDDEQLERYEQYARERLIVLTPANIFDTANAVKQLSQNTPPPLSSSISPSRELNNSGLLQQYEVALSYAGEDRELVDEVYQHLNNWGISVFYDIPLKVALWGMNLDSVIHHVYSTGSVYAVAFVSRHYVEKAWTNRERRVIQQIKNREEHLLPVMIDGSKMPDMLDTVAYVSMDNTTPYELAELIYNKVRRKNPHVPVSPAYPSISTQGETPQYHPGTACVPAEQSTRDNLMHELIIKTQVNSARF